MLPPAAWTEGAARADQPARRRLPGSRILLDIDAAGFPEGFTTDTAIDEGMRGIMFGLSRGCGGLHH